MEYRKDIEGLRAIAVISIILFHLENNFIINSGYVGVDIFFVISGYLITSIIYPKILSNNFSLVDFYERRVRRIFPAFLLVVFFALTIGYILFTFQLVRQLTNSAFSVLFVGANFFFWQDTDYFAPASFLKPFLHIWSLALEEQFYILFPPLLLFLAKYKKAKNGSINFILKFIFGLLLSSFILGICMTYIDRDTAFYLLPFRAWELLLGAFLAIYTVNSSNKQLDCLKQKTILSIASVFALGLLFFSVSSLDIVSTNFPGYVAIVPCLATLFCIELGKNKNSLTYKILSLKPLMFIGKLSYSLYLWHWIVIVYFRFYNSAVQSYTELESQIIMLTLTFICSLLSFYLVEDPIRKKKIFAKRKTIFIAMGLCTLVLTLYAVLLKEQVIPDLKPERVKYYADFTLHRSKQGPLLEDYPLSVFGDTTKAPTLLVMGDSQADVLTALLNQMGKEEKVSGAMYANQHPFFNIFREKDRGEIDEIREEHELVKEYIRKHDIKSVLFVAAWGSRIFGHNPPENTSEVAFLYYDEEDKIIEDSLESMKRSMHEMHEFFEAHNIQVFYMSPTQLFPFSVPDKASLLSYTLEGDELRNKVVTPYQNYKEFVAPVYEVFPFLEEGERVINLSDKICDDRLCYGLTSEYVPQFMDTNHFSIEGTMQFKEDFMPFIQSGR